jgi:geranylgeranylglycerol-phosphate geranylgeranyltransferase
MTRDGTHIERESTLVRSIKSDEPRQSPRRGGIPAMVEVTRPATSFAAALLALVGALLSTEADYASPLSDPARAAAFAFAWFCMAQATFAVNDAFDAPIDAVSHPWRPIPSGRVSTTDAVRLGIGLACLSVVLLAFISPSLGVLGLLYAAASWGYSARVKSSNGLAANAMVAGLIAVVPLSASLAGTPGDALWWTPIPIFLGVFAREILNDIEDADGDRVNGRPTLPLMLGNRWAYRLSALSWGCFVLASYLPALVQSRLSTALYVGLASVLNVLVLTMAVMLLRERDEMLVRLQLVSKLTLFAFVGIVLLASR